MSQERRVMGLAPIPIDCMAPEYVRILERRVAALEECLIELAPYGDVYEMDFSASFKGETQEACMQKGYAFKRDTLHIDQHIFRKAARLVAHRFE